MPKVYQACYRDKGTNYRINNGSRTIILAEARKAAKEHGVEVKIDILEIEKPSFKYFVECMNGRKPNKRTRLCSFIPKGQPILKEIDGEMKKRWKVKKI